MRTENMPVPRCNNMGVQTAKWRQEEENNELMFSFGRATLKLLLLKAFYMQKSHTKIHNINGATE